MSERKVKIESMVNYPVIISLSDFRFSRTFNRELQSTLMDYEIAEEALQRPGFRNLIKSGVLKITEKQDRIDLGLESEDEGDDFDPIVALSTKEIIGYLKGKDKDLVDVLNKVSNDLINRFVNVAVTSKISANNVINALNNEAKKRGMDVDMTALFKLADDAAKPVEEEKDNN